MPIANDFFSTFEELEISADRRVIIGDIINVAQEDLGIHYTDFFKSSFDIEDFHSYVEEKLISLTPKGILPHAEQYYRAYNQLVFLFSSVINEIQNGPISPAHIKLVNSLSENDCIITFNWDTLLDRALLECTNWKTDWGYLVKPRMIYRDGWKQPNETEANQATPKLLKLHGSSNWITSYPIPDDTNILRLNQTTPPETFYVYETTKSAYPCYEGRFEGPYEPFSYFYYPPNIPDDSGESIPDGYVLVKSRIKMPGMPESKGPKGGLTSMPLIIPPVKKKSYSLFGELFIKLWTSAETEIKDSDEIVIIGYSFPKSDTKTIDLFKKAFSQKDKLPKITIINPDPDRIIELFKMEFGIPLDNITVYKEYFSDEFDFDKI